MTSLRREAAGAHGLWSSGEIYLTEMQELHSRGTPQTRCNQIIGCIVLGQTGEATHLIIVPRRRPRQPNTTRSARGGVRGCPTATIIAGSWWACSPLVRPRFAVAARTMKDKVRYGETRRDAALSRHVSRLAARELLPALDYHVRIQRVQLPQERSPSRLLARDQRRATSDEDVQHVLALPRGVLNRSAHLSGRRLRHEVISSPVSVPVLDPKTSHSILNRWSIVT
jgi:hypothetical protein